MYMDRSEWWTARAIKDGTTDGDWRHIGNAGVRASNNPADIRYIDPTFNTLVNFQPQTATIRVSADSHDWSEQPDANYGIKLKKYLQECAIRYNDGVFNDTILYAQVGNVYTPIARFTLGGSYGGYEQDINKPNSWQLAGNIELIHYLPVGATAAQVEAGTAKENVVLYDVLNALGYPTTTDANGHVVCDFANARKFINKQLRAWVGVVANNGCDVALYVEQEKYDTYDSSKDFNVKLNTFNVNGPVEYEAAPRDPHAYSPVATFLTSWERPINLNLNPLEMATDANTEENVRYLLDYLKLYDWRGDKSRQGYMYDDHQWFWGYYNIKGIEADLRPGSVWTNMHQNERMAAGGAQWALLKDVSSSVRLWAGDPYWAPTKAAWGVYWLANGTKVSQPLGAGVSYNVSDEWGLYNYITQNQNPYILSHMGLSPRNTGRLAKFGSIYYENNETNVTTFDVAFPITIYYEWGSFTQYLVWHIDTTHGR